MSTVQVIGPMIPQVTAWLIMTGQSYGEAWPDLAEAMFFDVDPINVVIQADRRAFAIDTNRRAFTIDQDRRILTL